MRYSALLRTWLAALTWLTVASSSSAAVASSVPSSSPTAEPFDHDMELGMYGHNDTHSVLHLRSEDMGLHTDIIVPNGASDLMSAKPSDVLHIQSIVKEDAAAPPASESGEAFSSGNQGSSLVTVRGADSETEGGTQVTSPVSATADDFSVRREMDSSKESTATDSPPGSPVDSPQDVSSPAVGIVDPSISTTSATVVDDETHDANDHKGDSSDDRNTDLKFREQNGKQTDEKHLNEEALTQNELSEEEEEEETSSSEEEEAKDADGSWTPPQVVNGTVREAAGTMDTTDSQRQRNVTTFALVMCGTVGATFLVLVGVWINRIRRNERLRRLQEDDDEEFTVFSANDTQCITSTPGGQYAPLR